MKSDREILLELRAGSVKLERDMAKLHAKTAAAGKKAADSFSSTFSKSINTGLIIGGIITAFNGLKSAITAAFESRAAVAKMEQAVRQTGMAAGFSAGEIKKMADELSKLTGIDDDQALNDIYAQLLTFTNIKGDNFKQAAIAAADLATVVGTDLKSQTIQLGKALEDPEKGLTALTRVGITFTGQQKEQIAKLMEQNDLFGAQKIILDEINAKYGGQAAALSEAMGGTMQLEKAIGDLQENIGESAIPTLSVLVGILKDMTTAASESGNNMSTLTAAFKVVGTAAVIVINVFQQVIAVLSGMIATAVAAGNVLIKALTSLSGSEVKQAFNTFEKVVSASFNKLTNNSAELAKNLRNIWVEVEKEEKKPVNKNLNINTSSNNTTTNTEKNISETEAYMKRRESTSGNWEVNEVINDVDENKFEREQEALQEHLKAREEMLKENAIEEAAIERAKADEVKAAQEAANRERIKDVIKTYAELDTTQQGWLADAANNARQEIKVKAAEATAGYLASIFESVPFPLNIALAAGAGMVTSALFDSVIPKFAGGGDFIVPQGYNNDTFPMLVQSGERVRVTPAGSVGNETKMLEEISKGIKILALQNADSGNGGITVFNKFDRRGITTEVIKGQNRLKRSGVKTDEIPD